MSDDQNDLHRGYEGVDDEPEMVPVEIPAEETAAGFNEETEVPEKPRVIKEQLTRQQVKLLQHPVTKAIHKLDPAHTLSILNLRNEELNQLVANYPNMKSVSGDHGRRWLQALMGGREHMMMGDAFAGSLDRQEALWSQVVEEGGEQIKAVRPRLRSSGGEELTGERAVLRATSFMKLGSVVQVPLWHTGIWVTLKTPSDATLLELDRRITNEKIELGRRTSGMIFGNSSVYTAGHLLNMILHHVQDATVKNNSPEDLRNLIRVSDIPTLIWGILLTIYPGGYPYSQPCAADPTVCQHITEVMLDLSKLSWTDNRALSDFQRRHMQKRNEKHEVEVIKRYQEEHTRGGPVLKTVRRDELGGDSGQEAGIQFSVPTIAQYEQAGQAWIDGIVRTTTDAFGENLRGQERNDYLLQQASLTSLRQYGHWISEIRMEDDVVRERETIEEVLEAFSSDESLTQKILDHVQAYIDDTTLSLIAIPRYNCPNCGEPLGNDVDAHPYLLALDVMSIFFTLSDQRLSKVLSARTA